MNKQTVLMDVLTVSTVKSQLTEEAQIIENIQRNVCQFLNKILKKTLQNTLVILLVMLYTNNIKCGVY